MSAPVFLADAGSLAEARPGEPVLLDGAEGRHAVTVRRLRVGEHVLLTDGAGTEVTGTVAGARPPDRLDVTVDRVRRLPRPDPRLVVVQALAKGERGELAVELMTEVGVDVIVPWAAARSVAQWRADRATRGLARWRSTATEAAKQARRAWFPEVVDPAGTAEVADRLRTAALALVLHEEATVPLAGTELPPAGDVVLVVGPEGGVSPAELEQLAAAGARPVRLGETVLRTSTAGAAALAVLSARTRWA